jgi:hypothetical protein
MTSRFAKRHAYPRLSEPGRFVAAQT